MDENQSEVTPTNNERSAVLPIPVDREALDAVVSAVAAAFVALPDAYENYSRHLLGYLIDSLAAHHPKAVLEPDQGL